MDAPMFQRQQIALTNRLMAGVLDGLSDDHIVWRAEHSTANPISLTVLHTYFSEDAALHGAQGKPSLFVADGWNRRLPVDPTNVWAQPATLEADALREYATAVEAATSDSLDQLDPAELAREVDTPVGRRPLGELLSILLTTHKCVHLGEIAALRGMQGIQGLPF